jgi:hypothetical protein
MRTVGIDGIDALREWSINDPDAYWPAAIADIGLPFNEPFTAAALLAGAQREDVQHFVHVSIVGLQHMAGMNPYSRVKLAAEGVVRESNVRWSIVRATGFYWLLDRMLAKMARRRTLWLPADVRMQAVDSDEFAAFLVEVLDDSRRGEQPDFVEPQTLTMRELAEQYLAERELERRIRRAPMPRRIKRTLDAGNTSTTGYRSGPSGEWPEARVSGGSIPIGQGGRDSQPESATDRYEVGVRELQDRLDEHLDRVEKGAEILVRRHGRPVATLSRVGSP